MNKNMNDAIKNAIATNSVSNNLCFICLARLNHVITTRKQATPKQERQRSIIAKAVLENGIDKSVLIKQMRSLSESVFPTDKTITIISDMIERGNYHFDDSPIPDRWLKYKSDDQIQAESKRKPVVKRVDQTEKEFEELCHYIETEITHYNLTPDMVKKLRGLQKKEYTYPVILQCCKFYRDNITKSVAKTYFDNAYDKFCYILSIVKRKLPDTIQIIERRKNEEVQFWDETAQQIVNSDYSIDEMISLQCDKYPDTVYYGRNDYVRHQLLSAIERLSRK